MISVCAHYAVSHLLYFQANDHLNNVKIVDMKTKGISAIFWHDYKFLRKNIKATVKKPAS